MLRASSYEQKSILHLSRLILETYCIWHSHAAPFLTFWTFSYSKNFKFECCFAKVHFSNALNLLKKNPLTHTLRLTCFYEIYPVCQSSSALLKDWIIKSFFYNELLLDKD